ncbi:IS3 family transposase [Pseudoalteromonas sp. C2R02]|uniref:IS3 family transposase n=1 Tax=Pseudoalteromonas sp. C2R02 TaxID=2841565 RepID=UPI001C0A5FBB|nr:IS3 family transposase [Pseudoalteromonas sp. C2R02]MBU2972021.1 IS3 family transposase [Pseudoalteromonas sp. C2R02]
MSKGKRYTQEFKVEAVKQITERGYSVSEVSERLGICTKTLYHWRSQLSQTPKPKLSSDDQLKIAKLESELKRVTEERDIPKKGRKVLCQQSRVKYCFIRDHRNEFSVISMCRVMKLNRSGFYAWLNKPQSDRTIEDNRLLKLIKEFYIASGGTYGSPWIHQDLREAGEKCSVNRVAKIMRQHNLKAQIGYKRRYIKGGKPSRVADNLLARQFNPSAPNQSWVSDITYIRTNEGFLYLATVMDLFSRRIVGWSMDKNMDKQLVIKALLMAVYQRQPKSEVMVHSDQGSQYGSADYLAFMKEHNLVPSMSRRGNCHDNAVAESFFATIKKRIVRKKIYTTRNDAKAEIFNFIEMFYNPKKRHSHTGGISPAKFEEDYFSELKSV